MNKKIKKEIEQKYKMGSRTARAKQVAIYLGIGLSTVFYYARIGKLTPIKLSSRVTVFSMDEVDALIDNSMVKAIEK